MKKLFWIFFALIPLAGPSCQETIDLEKETETIKKVLEEENLAFLSRDFDRFAANYIKDENNIRISSSATGYRMVKGWDEIEALFKEYFQNNPEPGTDRYVWDDYTMKIYKKNAWVVNDQTVYDPEGNVRFTLIGTIMLEKEDEAWKITYLSVVNTSSYKEFDEGDTEESEEE